LFFTVYCSFCKQQRQCNWPQTLLQAVQFVFFFLSLERKHFVFPLLVCCAIGLLASGFLLTTQTVHAQTQQAASTCPNRVIKGNHYTCYNRQGQATSQGTLSPQTSTWGNCNLMIYQNGPFLASSGWVDCITGYGLFNIPTAYNDQASSWASCANGTFYVDSGGKGTSAPFGDLKWGNFPLGNVPNDSLSSVNLLYQDSCPFYVSGPNHNYMPYPYFYTGNVS
jgi:hypothetical protein